MIINGITKKNIHEIIRMVLHLISVIIISDAQEI